MKSRNDGVVECWDNAFDILLRVLEKFREAGSMGKSFNAGVVGIIGSAGESVVHLVRVSGERFLP